jgi:hypothetical protein
VDRMWSARRHVSIRLYVRINIFMYIYIYIYILVRCGPHVVGSQAFFYTPVFNSNIGAWNMASVLTLSQVCALRP